MTRPIEVLIHHMRGVAGSRNAWEAGFARSILRHSKRRNWRPTPAQDAIMNRLAGELFNEDNFDVLEDFDE